MSRRLGLRPTHVTASCCYLVTTLCLIALILANHIEQLAGAGRGSKRLRGGHLLKTPYDMFNKWVVVFRRHEAPQSSISSLNDTVKHNYMSLGYGLYYRKDGWMLANMEGVLEGAKMMEEQRMNMSGWFIHSNETKRVRKNHENNRSGVEPYRVILSHAFTYPGPNIGVFRAYLDNYEEVIRAPPYGQPSWSIVYPMAAWLPEIAKKEDQRINCYIFIHDLFDDDLRAGYDGSIPYQWRYWPVERNGSCEGPICKFKPNLERVDIGALANESDQHGQAGQICDIPADRGAPIFCHTQDKEWTDADSPEFTDDGRRLNNGWKLAYTVIRPVSINQRACSRIFTAFDLTYARDTLYDGNLEHLVPDHVRPNPNPSEIL